MKITYLGHAGFCVEVGRTLVVMDPWFTKNGAFDKAWFQFPRNHHVLRQLQKRMEAAEHVALYVSHEHEDHFDRETLTFLRKFAPTVVIPDYQFKDFRAAMETCGFEHITELPDDRVFKFGDADIRIFIDESGINRDSAILVRGPDNRVFLNFNDCKIFDRCDVIKQNYGPIDVFACQFTGATMHPICYEYDDEKYASVSRSKRMSKFRGVKTALDRLAPRAYIPSAGPAAFLDPQLFHLNFEKDSVFPKSWDFKEFLAKGKAVYKYAEMMPGATLGVDAELAMPSMGFDFDESQLKAYLTQYQREVFTPPAKTALDLGMESFREILMHQLHKKMDIHADFRERLPHSHPLYLQFDELPGYIKADFATSRMQTVEKIDDAAYYLHSGKAEHFSKVIFGHMPWEAYFLTFRFKNVRVPDEYDSAVNLFMFAEVESYRFGLEQLVKFRGNTDRIQVALPDGITYEVNRFCPHQGADMKFATLDGATLVCPRHRWRFDLENDGKCTANDDSLCAVKVPSKSN